MRLRTLLAWLVVVVVLVISAPRVSHAQAPASSPAPPPATPASPSPPAPPASAPAPAPSPRPGAPASPASPAPPAAASAPEVLQAPVGGRAISVGNDRVACPGVAGWTLGPDAHSVRPPAAVEDIGRRVVLRVAPSAAACATTSSTVTLVSTGPLPSIDGSASIAYVDDGRLELRGRGLDGVRVRWRASGRGGEDVCTVAPRAKGEAPGPDACVVAVGRGLPADPTSLALSWAPKGGVADERATTFDAQGRRLTATETAIAPGRIVVSFLVPTPASVDLSGGGSKVPLVHPEAVGGVDCSPATCAVESGALALRGVTHGGATLAVKFRLLPHVVLARPPTAPGGAPVLDPSPSIDVAVLRCPMTVAGAAPLRDVDDARLVVRLEGRCAAEARSLRVFVDDRPADTLQVEVQKDTAYALVRAGRLDGAQVTVRANRPEPDGTLVAVTRAATRAAPVARATLELEGAREPVDFIPTNRPAIVRVAEPGEGARLVVLPVEGVYTVTELPDGLRAVQAVGAGGGYVGLRFAYRASSLPGGLAEANLAVQTDPLQRPIKEANVAAALAPFAELQCVDSKGAVRTMTMGAPEHVPYDERDGCRLVIHRERLRREWGAQRLTLNVDVTRVDGTARPEAHVAQQIVLRPGSGARVAWIKGATAPYDRLSVSVSHVADESQYVSKAEEPLVPPAAQWTVFAGTSVARLYLTAAIPTVLYRIADRAHSGVLSLDFGVISRLTWLDRAGNEGFIALESGVMGVGLAPVDTSSQGQSLRQVAIVGGLGLGVPIANRSLASQASINLHGWFEYEISRDLGNVGGTSIGFLFGPSISIGNIGTNL